MYGTKGHISLWTLLAAGLLAGLSVSCSDSDTSTPLSEEQEIRFNADVWQVMDGTRATTYDNISGVQGNGFSVYAFMDGEDTQYISGSTVSYVSSQWTFDNGKHYWPASGALNFFAHVPKDLSSTCYSFDPTPYNAETNPDGYSEDAPRIVCTNLPVTFSGQSELQELVYAYKASQSKAVQGVDGVTLNFMHPFARIYLQWASYNHSAITLNSITLKGVKNNGICTLNGAASPQISTWTLTGDATNFTTTTLDAHDAANPNAYLVIPQSFTGDKLNIEVNANWDDWGENISHTVSTSVTTEWEAGKSYTYTFTITQTDLKVDVERFTEQW